MFTDDRIVKDLRYMGQKYFSVRIAKLDKAKKKSLLMHRWKFKRAPA